MNKRPLSKPELLQLDKDIDSYIPADKLISQSLNKAIVHSLIFFEDHYRLYSRLHYAVIRNGIDGINNLMKWIYQHSKDDGNMDFSFNQEIYGLMAKLHENGMDYSYLWDLMTEAQRGKLIAFRDKNEVQFEEADKKLRDMEVADTIISHTEDRDNFIGVMDTLNLDATQVFQKLTVWKSGRNKIRYIIPDSTFIEVKRNLDTVRNTSLELNDEWDVGGYKVRDFRSFWSVLATLSMINMIACMYSGLQGGALESTVLIKNKKRWIREIADRTGLGSSTVENIFNDLVYEPELYNTQSRKQPDIIYQPFFCLGNNIYALSSALVLNSSSERNMWSLTAILREDVHSKLKNLKEKSWLEELKEKLEKKGYQTYDGIKFELNKQKGQIDLLVVDKKLKEIAVIELKWLNQPDRVSEVMVTSEQIEKGTKQAQSGKRWLESSTEQAARLIKINTAELKQYTIYPLVLSKNSMGINHYSVTEVGVMNEYLFNSILFEPLGLNIGKLWKILTTHAYIPQEGKDFLSKDIKGSFGQINYIGYGAGMEIVEGSWDINKIDLSSL